MQYPWGYALPVSHIITTHESYPQYLWGYALPVSHIISIRESYPQYPWGYALPVSHIISIRESYPQYPWGYAVPVSHIISTREDMHYPWGKFHSFFIRINLLTGTAYPHGYRGYDSRVLMIWLTGNAYPHGYCIPSRVLHIVYTGWFISSVIWNLQLCTVWNKKNVGLNHSESFYKIEFGWLDFELCQFYSGGHFSERAAAAR